MPNTKSAPIPAGSRVRVTFEAYVDTEGDFVSQADTDGDIASGATWIYADVVEAVDPAAQVEILAAPRPVGWYPTTPARPGYAFSFPDLSYWDGTHWRARRGGDIYGTNDRRVIGPRVELTEEPRP